MPVTVVDLPPRKGPIFRYLREPYNSVSLDGVIDFFWALAKAEMQRLARRW
jgi:hypothetical protein